MESKCYNTIRSLYFPCYPRPVCNDSIPQTYYKQGGFTAGSGALDVNTHSNEGFLLGKFPVGSTYLNGEIVEVLLYDRFLDFNELHVSIKSPIPDNPKIVSFFALKKLANLTNSTKDLVIRALLAFSPKFNPSDIPAAIAYIFFKAPPT